MLEPNHEEANQDFQTKQASIGGMKLQQELQKLHSSVPMSADFLPPPKETSNVLLLLLLRGAHPSLPSEYTALPHRQHPPQVNLGTSSSSKKSEVPPHSSSIPIKHRPGNHSGHVTIYFIQISCNRLVVPARFPQGPEALKSFHPRFPSQPMRQCHGHKTHETHNRSILPAQQFLSPGGHRLYPSTGV